VKDVRKLEERAIIWPIYFDIAKSRKEGRRVPKNCAVQSPKITELKEAADKLGIENEINLETRFPKTPWVKGGSMVVTKNEPKEAIIQKLAKQLTKIKSQQASQQPTRR
jgi:signal recognition particle subunit SRP19